MSRILTVFAVASLVLGWGIISLGCEVVEDHLDRAHVVEVVLDGPARGS